MWRTLVDRFGAERVADQLLAKWLSDPAAWPQWDRLRAAVNMAPLDDRLTPKPRKYWVILWYISMGYSNQDVADQLDIGEQSVKREIQYARNRLGMIGKPMTGVVAEAIRRGIIP